MHNDDDYENMNEEEFNERLKIKGDLLVKILNKSYEVGGGLELVISIMAQKFTPEGLENIYETIEECGRDIIDFGNITRELDYLEEDDDESNRN